MSSAAATATAGFEPTNAGKQPSGFPPQTKQQLEAHVFVDTPLGAELVRRIKGNAPQSIKALPVKWLAVFRNRGNAFAHNVADRMRVTDVDVLPRADDKEKMEGRVVVEVVVADEMCDADGVLSQGALVFLVDECSTLSMVVANANEGRISPPGVSCSINIMFHGSARSGATLRIINRSLASGHDANSGRSEVWDIANHKMIASGTQLTMPPSRPVV
ncbi:hypothetical protein FA15DRAFT_611077 [Coprinopsis marcescibilis]|uniref:Thioesterase domain-containing protein n=1 Tax=Coprinopsis marcescibilis TaxID=230819 RepID=A0A5C3L875_COPMA|nr:hypothetical protein FA15DRAFT_611077 [Coprinopsis marcescibilis]